MLDRHRPIDDLLRRVRGRWRRLTALRAAARTALVASAVMAVALVAARLFDRAPLGLAVLGLAATAAIAFVAIRGLAPLRRVPDDRKIARFIEEREPSLDDRLVTAVDVARTERPGAAPSLAEPMMADTERRLDAIDLDRIVPADAVRRAALQAAAAIAVFALLAAAARTPAREAFDAATLALFPSHVRLEVAPGHARVKAGATFAVDARLVGNRAPVLAAVEIVSGGRPRTIDMAGHDGRFHASLGEVDASFTYRVVAGGLKSPDYRVDVARAPRVTRIDVDYTYPAGLQLPPRTEEDSGDIYAPAGTDVKLHVHTDRAATKGEMALGDGNTIALAAESPTRFTTAFRLLDDNSYRVALADAEGLVNRGDTEYFIRRLEDRPPDVRIVKPAADRAVTRLEEVDIEAQATDDYGLDRMDLVYSVRGGAEKVVPLPIPRRATSASARHTLSLEDLNVQPGDFVSYYVRARDITRGTRPNETRSDIYFLEVRPFEQEFTLAQSSAAAGAGGSSVDDLVTAQKEIVVATWKLDRRAKAASGGKSEQDIRAVGRGEAELKTRVEQTSSTFRESTMRDPRKRSSSDAPRAGQSLPEEDAMGAAAAAMGKAVTSLDALKTSDALPPEMEALNHLLKAQAEVKKRQVSRQQAGNGSGNNNRNYDMSTLFDKELQKQTQTNYENRSTAENRSDAANGALDKVKELARRQDELTKAQADLAKRRASMSDEELKRELDRLTREQTELRQRAEEAAQDLERRSSSQSSASEQSSGQQSAGRQASGQTADGRSSGGQPNQAQGANGSKAMREISEQMRSAAGDLRRQDPAQAAARGNRALDKLRELQRQMESATPDERRRALGDMQLEARQLADAERQVASAAGKVDPGASGADAARQLAGEQDRLAERARKLKEGLRQQAAGAGVQTTASDKETGGAAAAARRNAQAASEAAAAIDRQQLADKMQKSAEAMRGGADAARGQADAQREIARSLDSLADKLGNGTGATDGEGKKLADQLARARDLKDQLDRLSREMARLGQQNGRGGSQSSAQKTPGDSGRGGQGQASGTGSSGSDLARLREEYQRRLQETRELMDELKRDDPNYSQGGTGFTYRGQGMTLSAPGTEAFKQDFSRWEQLRQEATTALDRAETTLSKALQAKEAHDRLAAGIDDKAPPEYQKQVDSYFKAIAAKKKG
jgi:hypothetical protein